MNRLSEQVQARSNIEVPKESRAVELSDDHEQRQRQHDRAHRAGHEDREVVGVETMLVGKYCSAMRPRMIPMTRGGIGRS